MKRMAAWAVSGAAALLLLGLPALAASTAAKTMPDKSQTMRIEWAPETLSGTVEMVDPSLHLVVVQGPSGVPFDMVITHRTRIESGNRAVPFNDLSQYKNKNVSVRFVPESRGDVAQSIRIGG